MVNELLNQQVIDNNKEIYARIEHELKNANSEILVAIAWFTDHTLLDLLLQKASEGVKVELIIADNKENKKLDFQQLVARGASVLRVKNVGYGMMHQKFCVVDRRIALHGSFNWSVNAKKNNHESIIATNHKDTIDKLVQTFFDIKQKALAMKADSQNSITTKLLSIFGTKRNEETIIDEQEEVTPIEATSPIETSQFQVDSKTEYEKVLDSMIAAEVSNFDRSLLRQQGYDRAKSNNGDHNVLYKALDSLYSVFITDINVVEDKKTRLITKIEEQKVKSTIALKENLDLQLNTIESECEITKENLTNKKANLEAQVAISNKEIDSIKNIKIPAIQDKTRGIEEKIKVAEREFVKPAFKWFEFIPVAIVNLGLLIYLTLFYSSAAYILLFSKLEAEEVMRSGGTPIPLEVFNPDAIGNAFDKGGVATLFILMFVFLPLAFAIAGRFNAKKWLSIVGVVLVDGAIAYKVAESIHQVAYMSGKVTELWKPLMVFQDANFYLVFVMGAGGLLFFKYAFDKFISYFEERNPDINAVKNQVYMAQLKSEIDVNNAAITSLKEEIETLEKTIIQYKSDIIICEAELEALPGKRVNQIEKRKTEFALKVQNIEITTDIYKSHIENDNLPISVDSMKDRINVFLEGWNDLLHDEYAIAKAVEKSRLAAEVATEWQSQKLDTNKIDKRIKA
jgi:hypothetical protein